MTAGDDLFVVERARSTALAEQLKSLLEAEGIPAFLDPYSAEEVISGEMYSEFTGVDVKVAARDYARAMTALAERHHDSEVLRDLDASDDRAAGQGDAQEAAE